MIVAKQKDMADILRAVRPFGSVVVAGCGTCVTVCLAGSEEQARHVARCIRQDAEGEGRQVQVQLASPIRQCDRAYLDGCEEELAGAECILSLACGAGVQFLAEKFPGTVVLPGVDTSFIGVEREPGYWTEMCQGCGDCMLELTGGVCPVARCAKSHFNGPCGGSVGGRCEIDPDVLCAWQLIYNRLKRLGRLEQLSEINEVRDWRGGYHSGPRSLRCTPGGDS